MAKEKDMDIDFVIRVVENGPYEVYASIPIYKEKYKVDEDGNAVDYISQSSKNSEHSTQERRDIVSTKEKVATNSEGKNVFYLCRCGKSKNKPFCDGEHECAKFKGDETASRKTVKELSKHYNGVYLDLLDRKDLCAVARFCDTKQNTWYEIIRGNVADAGLAVYQGLNCPSGRLTLIKKDGTEIENEYNKELVLLYDPKFDCKGPIAVRGGILIISSDGYKYEKRNRWTLCRCGESKNMPFCDSAHLECPHMKGMDE